MPFVTHTRVPCIAQLANGTTRAAALYRVAVGFKSVCAQSRYNHDLAATAAPFLSCTWHAMSIHAHTIVPWVILANMVRVLCRAVVGRKLGLVLLSRLHCMGALLVHT